MNRHGVYEETIKDAVMLHRYFYNLKNEYAPHQIERLNSLISDISLPPVSHIAHASSITESCAPSNRRQLWAEYAEHKASKGIEGVHGDPDYRELCAYWPNKNIYVVLKDSWCAAFVYHCCRYAGLFLPIRYPNGKCRFAGVAAWLEWAQLPEVKCFHSEMDIAFTPARGDIVIYEKLLSNESHDHIGIVLSCDKDELIVAEGNKDNKNRSAIVRRDRWSCIAGYIRVDDKYEYSYAGEYEPQLD